MGKPKRALKVDRGALVAQQHGLTRSPHWPSIEKAFLKEHPSCKVCGVKVGLQIHHAGIPFHYAILLGRPDLELDPRNLITLCETEDGVISEDHHLLVGHLHDFQSYNPNCFEDALKTYHGMTYNEIFSDDRFYIACKNKPKAWGAMTQEDKVSMRKDLDKRFPPPYVDINNPLGHK